MSTEANFHALLSFTETERTDTYDFISVKPDDLPGRSVFITGASKGIGRETALAFSRAGCSKIAIGARSSLTDLASELKQAASDAGCKEPPQVLALTLDVDSEDSVKAAAEAVAREFGGALDILINNAGFLEPWVPFTESDPSKWWRAFEVNVRGTYLVSRYCLPMVLRSELKTNILLSSYGALSLLPGGVAYQTTKFAVCRLAEHLAAEYADQGLVCFALNPGRVVTELASNLPEHYHPALVDTPALPAHSLVWLSKERRTWLSGRWATANWDMEQLEGKKDLIVKNDLLKFRMTHEVSLG
ncbi:NAD-P-binding protein [Apiospora arundinis]|uniref:NAD-P-binding protein n=1 Tax=Apiospora arundinis TaxID=335852 RepID=A0ABR2HT09_9PEZI